MCEHENPRLNAGRAPRTRGELRGEARGLRPVALIEFRLIRLFVLGAVVVFIVMCVDGPLNEFLLCCLGCFGA